MNGIVLNLLTQEPAKPVGKLKLIIKHEINNYKWLFTVTNLTLTFSCREEGQEGNKRSLIDYMTLDNRVKQNVLVLKVVKEMSNGSDCLQ